MLVLASASPRRRELLMQAGFRFDVEPSRVEEALRPGEDAASFATRLAREKAAAVFERRRSVSRAEGGLLVLGADTVVVCDREICGKPQDPADAARMLRRLGGRTHGVITGLALISSAKPEPNGMDRNIEIASAVTYVTMRTLSEAEIDKIRDIRVREIVLERFQACGRDMKRFRESLSRDPLTVAPRGGGNGHRQANPIRKVRLLKLDQTIQPIRNGTAYVKPGSTHHICIFELPGSTPERPKRTMVAVTMLEAARRAKVGEPIIQRVDPDNPHAKFLFSLSWGEMVEGAIRSRDDLYCFRTAASTQGQIYFVSHLDARPSSSATKFATKASTMPARKVHVDCLGTRRRASD